MAIRFKSALDVTLERQSLTTKAPDVVANTVVNTEPMVANKPLVVANTVVNKSRSADRHADKDKRREYMREYMRARRAKP